MLKVFISLITFALILYSCSEKTVDIDAPEPIKELISKISNCTCDPFVRKYLWRNQTIYVVGSAGPACDTMPPSYYDENGQILKMTVGYTFDDFLKETQLINKVWSCGS